MDTTYITIWMWASFIRDIGVILGVPIIIGSGYKLYKYHIGIIKAQVDALKTSNDVLKEMQEKQINTLEAENKLLKETQYDKALAIIEAQKRLHQMERDKLEQEISQLISEKSELEKVNRKIARVYTSTDEAIAKLAEILSKKELKHLEAEAWEDFLDLSISPEALWASFNLKKEE